MPDISVDPAGVFPSSDFSNSHKKPRNTEQNINIRVK